MKNYRKGRAGRRTRSSFSSYRGRNRRGRGKTKYQKGYLVARGGIRL